MHTVGTLLGLLALLSPADARRRTPEPIDDPCGLDKVYADTTALNGFIFEPGYGSGDTEDQAKTDAREAAKNALIARLGCSGTSWADSEFCDAVKANIDPWSGKSRQDRKKHWEACTTAALPESFVDELRNAAAQLEVDMAVMASQVATATAGRRLGLMTPVWPTGCATGEAGKSLLHGLERGLGQLPLDQQPRLLLGAGHQLDRDDRRLLLKLEERKGTVHVSAHLVSPTDCTSQVVSGGLAFPSHLLDVPDGEQGRCATDQLTGIAAYGVCAGDLRVEVDVPSDDGVICPGGVVEPTVRVSQPARVQVFSVGPDGTAQLVFPMDGASDLVEGQLSLGTFDAVHTEGDLEDRLVALAVPAGQRFGTTEGWQGWCEVPGKWHDGLRPAAAAAGVSSFVIPAPGSAMCKDGPTVQYEHAAAPRCGR